jgi:hypothetical protein
MTATTRGLTITGKSRIIKEFTSQFDAAKCKRIVLGDNRWGKNFVTSKFGQLVIAVALGLILTSPEYQKQKEPNSIFHQGIEKAL